LLRCFHPRALNHDLAQQFQPVIMDSRFIRVPRMPGIAGSRRVIPQ
jgi:hypothetical protein